MSRDARLVYSTDPSTRCPTCGRTPAECRCQEGAPNTEPVPARLTAKLRLEKAGRGGKTVTVVYDLPRNRAFLSELAGELKRACGAGGATRDDAIELQGDLRDRVRDLLTRKGYRVKG